MYTCPKCNAVLAVRLVEEVAVKDVGGNEARAYCAQLVCPNRACENGSSGTVLQRSVFTPPLPAHE